MKKCKTILRLLISVLVLVGCSSVKKKLIPTNNDGGYTITISKGKFKIKEETIEMLKSAEGSVTIRGHVFDMKTREPLSNVRLKTGCFEFRTTSLGEYSFRTRNLEGNSFFMEVFALAYRAVETKYINIHNKNEVIIDFYLVQDEKPIIECVGQGAIEKMQNELNNLK